MRDTLCVCEGPVWYVIRAHHRQEPRADANLRTGGIETFLPTVQFSTRRRPTRNDREALFPQYLFARFDARLRIRDVIFARGVQTVVRLGGQLATIDDEVISFLRSQGDEHGSIQVGQKLERGDRVAIECGPFADLVGVVERNLQGRERVVVLLTTIAISMRIELPASHLRKCSVPVPASFLP